MDAGYLGRTSAIRKVSWSRLDVKNKAGTFESAAERRGRLLHERTLETAWSPRPDKPSNFQSRDLRTATSGLESAASFWSQTDRDLDRGIWRQRQPTQYLATPADFPQVRPSRSDR